MAYPCFSPSPSDSSTWSQIGGHLFWRNPSAAFFNFALPLIFLLLIATVFHTDKKELNVLIPGIAGMAIMATTFSALSFNLTFYREQGILKRILGTPLPPGTYFSGLIASAVTNAIDLPSGLHRGLVDDCTDVVNSTASRDASAGTVQIALYRRFCF